VSDHGVTAPSATGGRPSGLGTRCHRRSDLTFNPALNDHVWIPAAIAGALLSLFSYRSAVAAAVSFGNLVRSVSDLYRRDLLRRIGLTLAECPDDEQKQWKALGQLLFRSAVDRDAECLIRFTADSPLHQLPGDRTSAAAAAKDTGERKRRLMSTVPARANTNWM
jgi:hypothetical protein